MNLEGYQAIDETLKAAGIQAPEGEALVLPQPPEGEHRAFVTVTTHREFVASDVLNALAGANLIAGSISRTGSFGPRLMPILSHEGSITFRDMNNGK